MTSDSAPAIAAPAAAPTVAAGLGYQRSLDGMRAIAIVLVLLFHYPFFRENPFTHQSDLRIFNDAPVHGGFLGVDVFFVLSGFLITMLLLEERNRHGTI